LNTVPIRGYIQLLFQPWSGRSGTLLQDLEIPQHPCCANLAKGPSELVKARQDREAAGRFDYVAAAGRRRPGRLGHGRAGHEAQVARKHG
jgi:hypothetical protein